MMHLKCFPVVVQWANVPASVTVHQSHIAEPPCVFSMSTQTHLGLYAIRLLWPDTILCCLPFPHVVFCCNNFDNEYMLQ